MDIARLTIIFFQFCEPLTKKDDKEQNGVIMKMRGGKICKKENVSGRLE
jgi:hypothetical protein